MLLPACTIVIPVHNEAGFVTATTHALLAQAGPAVELLLVENGSTDTTLARFGSKPG